MSLDALLEMLELSFYELQFAFEGLAHEHVWKRPAPQLLSIGEIAGHCAYWHMVRLVAPDANDPDLSRCPVSSPLIDRRFRYYPGTLAEPPSEEHRALTAEQVYAELVRVHRETIERFKLLNPDLDTAPPGCEPQFTYREHLKYQAFHIAYHTGQIYSVRHLLGEKTPDN